MCPDAELRVVKPAWDLVVAKRIARRGDNCERGAVGFFPGSDGLGRGEDGEGSGQAAESGAAVHSHGRLFFIPVAPD
jgi:hypothetical protein